MISVLIPVYNYDIVLLVEKIHQQIHNQNIPYEILIADDASTSADIKATYPQIKNLAQVFQFEENKGRTYTRNFLANQAKFDNLLFLDADVLPEKEDFIVQFLLHKNQSDLIFGGINYTEKCPDPEKMLRWKYGKERESRSLEEREENPYISIISGAIFIKKDLFLQTNPELKNLYGLDSVFVHNLQKENAKIKHINNPVLHLGLEKNEDFIKKTESGLKSLVFLEKENMVSRDYRAVQRAYEKLKTYKLTKVYKFFYGLIQSKIHKNLLRKNPSLFYFDLYKLMKYIEFKEESD